MKVGEFCNREVIIVKGNESVKAVAELMRKHHVGNVVLVEEQQGKRIPKGIITDRDLVLEVLAPGLEAGKLFASDIIQRTLHLIHEDNSLLEALELMRNEGIRRLPVVDANKALIGIITIDDITELLTEILGLVTGVIKRQQKQEITRRP